MAIILFYILASTFLVSLISFIGILTLFLKEKVLDKLLPIMVAFAAGALIGGAFLHLLPEAVLKIGIEESSILKLFIYLLLGFTTFFILEQFINWHHHHAREHPDIMPFSYLILVSDGIHNFIDGLVIAGAFLISPYLGLTTTIAVTLHEIPQELGDFGILVYGGFGKIKALFLNFLSAITAMLGGIVGFLTANELGGSIVFLLPFAAGNFLYIASTDLIPEIKGKSSLKEFFVFLLGLSLMLALKMF
jgi:zinc and cadmium transporter